MRESHNGNSCHTTLEFTIFVLKPKAEINILYICWTVYTKDNADTYVCHVLLLHTFHAKSKPWDLDFVCWWPNKKAGNITQMGTYYFDSWVMPVLKFIPETMNGINSYDPDILQKVWIERWLQNESIVSLDVVINLWTERYAGQKRALPLMDGVDTTWREPFLACVIYWTIMSYPYKPPQLREMFWVSSLIGAICLSTKQELSMWSTHGLFLSYYYSAYEAGNVVTVCCKTLMR